VVVVAVGVRSRQACARRRIPIPDRRVPAAARELLAVGTEAHGSDEGRMPPQGAQNFLPRLCADEVYATIRTTRRDDVAGGPALHAVNFRVKARRAPAARSVVVPQEVDARPDPPRPPCRRTRRGDPRRARRTRRRRARLHGTQRSGTRTASCGGAAARRRLRSAARSSPPRWRPAAALAWRADDSRCTWGPFPESSGRREIPHRTRHTQDAALCREARRWRCAARPGRLQPGSAVASLHSTRLFNSSG